MELKVWVEGLQKIVSGVTESTTCQDIVFALAHATGKTGRYTLIERFRNNERLLTPQDQPIKELMKLGEYANEVHFILQRSFQTNSSQKWQHGTPPSSPQCSTLSPQSSLTPSQSISQSHSNSLSPTLNHSASNQTHPIHSNYSKDIRKHLGDPSDYAISLLNAHSSLRIREDKAHPRPHDVKSSHTSHSHQNNSSQQSHYNVPLNNNTSMHNGMPPRKDGAILSPPPYREPPPPTQSPARVSPPTSLTTIRVKPKKIILKDLQSHGDEALLYNSQYRELVRLINYQRDKLSTQQVELTKYDAEIMFWEGKTREQQHQMEFMAEETLKIEAVGRQTEQQIKGLSHVEDENEIERQQEKTLNSEITLLKTKLANCETELLQCKNKIRLLLEEVQFEQRLLAKETEERHHVEKSLLSEVERLQKGVDQARQDTENAAQSGDKISKEVAALESAIVEKKKHLEKLIGDMKDANLQSLTIAPSEELKLLVDGPHKLGSTRRMIGSPRQLENAVPTSKNPHGVWV